ncbi:Scytalone dehydratase [Aspergillus spectabilis]
MSSTSLSFEEYLEVNRVSFEWAESYDNKDWKRLHAILAPELSIDYTDVIGKKWSKMSAEEFVQMAGSKHFLGGPDIYTQHLLGSSCYEKLSDTEINGKYQIRAAHVRYTDLETKEVKAKGHGHGVIHHSYEKIDGQWKLSGLRPQVRWNEYNFAGVVGDAFEWWQSQEGR